LLRPALVLLAVFVIVGFAGVAFQGVRTVQMLTRVEAERDQWQHPGDVILALHLNKGSVVVDFGSGAGYFSLKLSDAVGASGRVLAIDLRKLSLFFLRARAFLQGKHNIETIVGEVDDPHLAESSADAVLIANTYHELTAPEKILAHLLQALRPGGRLVVVDRSGTAGHNADPAIVEAQLRENGFMIVSREDAFIRPPGDEQWWLIVATKP
jgi:predicted methyltransferase